MSFSSGLVASHYIVGPTSSCDCITVQFRARWLLHESLLSSIGGTLCLRRGSLLGVRHFLLFLVCSVSLLSTTSSTLLRGKCVSRLLRTSLPRGFL